MRGARRVACRPLTPGSGVLLVRSWAMKSLATTRLSSKGQVVIPEEIRDRLGLRAGAEFVVLGERDVVILKSLARPAMEEFDGLVRRARNVARKAGLKPAAIRRAISRVRAAR